MATKKQVPATEPAAPTMSAKRSKFLQSLATNDKVGMIDAGATKEVPRLSTGSPLIDEVLGGGWVWGTQVEIYGSESSGKTSLCLSTAREAQALGKRVLYVDFEHALRPDWVEALGVVMTPDKWILFQPEYGEAGLDLVSDFLDAGEADLVIIDSVAACVPRAELEGDIEQILPGLQARMMGKALRHITGKARKNGALVIWINQVRDKIAMGGPHSGGKTTPGGNALKFFASIRCDLARTENITQSGSIIGIRQKVTCRKNKTAPPFRSCVTEFYFDKGYDPKAEIWATALAKEIIVSVGGGFYNYLPVDGEPLRLARGAVAARAELENQPELYKEVEDRVMGLTKQTEAGLAEEG